MNDHRIAEPHTDSDRKEDHRALADMHPGNRIRLMMGMTLLPEPIQRHPTPSKQSHADQDRKTTVEALCVLIRRAEGSPETRSKLLFSDIPKDGREALTQSPPEGLSGPTNDAP